MQAAAATVEFCKNSMVGVIIGTQGDFPEAVGSGALIRVGSRLIIITAAHIAREGISSGRATRLHAIRAGLDGAVYEIAERVFFHPDSEKEPPDDIDVALILVSRNCSPAFDARPIRELADIGTTSVVGPGEQLLSSGYPVELRRPSPGRSEHNAFYSLPKLRRGCHEYRHPARGLHMDWGSESVELVSGGVSSNPHPRGMSGAPVWRLPAVEKGALWAPTSQAKLVGVSSAYWSSLNCQRAEAVEHWREWFDEVIASIPSTEHAW